MDIANKMIGTLLPMSALRSQTGQVGTMEIGYKFVDWLAKTGQTGWQLLPLNQTELESGSSSKHVPSPYKGYGIGLDPRYLSEESKQPTIDEMSQFLSEHGYWIREYSLFCALRDHFGTDRWMSWPEEIANFDQVALDEWRSKLADEIKAHEMIQAKLHLEYAKLRSYARDQEVYLIGDMPFYVGLNSPLVWMNQDLFELSNGDLERVSGVLPGIKSHYGRQVWGHPLYRWGEQGLYERLLNLFESRIRHLTSLFDYVRFDHAKGLFSYGALDTLDPSRDKYEEGPGAVFFDKIVGLAALHKLQLFAEDTGDKLIALRESLKMHNLPGVKIFRFAYNEKRKVYSSQYLDTTNYPENTFAYTTTHDTDTLVGYLAKLSDRELSALSKKMGIEYVSGRETVVMAIRDRVVSSPAKYVIIPLQDWLLSSTRINTPGTESEHDDPNWRYVMEVPVEELPELTYFLSR